MAVVSAALVMGWPAPAGADGTRDQQWQVGYLDLARAHELSQGEGVTVAVIDTGVDGTHPDLEGNVLPGIDAYSVANGGQPGDGWNDTHGHGTAMAGLIAAHGHGPGNGDGALGIAPQAKIIPMRVSDGEGNAAYQQAMDLAIAEAISRDVDIISLSQRGFDLLGIEPALDAGILVVVAGGNAPGDGFVNAPSGSLVVGAVRADGSVADVTTRGIRPPPPVDELGSTTALQTGFLILTAPGEGITSTTLDHGYRSGTGTSDSTAIVSGAAALVMARYPDLTAEQVMSHLVETSTDKGAPGPDVDYGWGDLDIVRALETEPTIPTTTVTTQAPTTIAPQPGDGGETAGAEPGDGSDIAAPWLVVAVGAVVAAAAAFGLSAASRRRHAPAFAGTGVAPPPPGPARPGPIGAPPPPGPAPGPMGAPPPP
ncbi:MAG TPA: S8 family serine peptidase, partial [Acidimicrobiales bacterium]